ncbi:TetR/AcrR family transcriptional regulator [Micromonospora sp. 067-2]|uniref:TetR/AcrR family transcriptional regulator n=1 Tax=Micromonospora sp. 067-2 TaxID=2789270 RepID=UPI00397D9DF0
MSAAVRLSAAERRGHVLAAARIEFGRTGFSATSTEAIARRVGVSQPYLFRLFPSKKAIFLATIEDCFDRIVRLLEEAAGAETGETALKAMGRAYNEQLDDRSLLQMQLQMWATACEDEEVRQLARRQMARVWGLATRISGANDQRVMQFMASGMLLNVFAAMDLPRIKEQLGDSLTGLSSPPDPT